jgi:adenylosuccinate synthase
MYTDVLIGLQWGDEGKGKIVDYLARQYEIVARFQGGPNAGHTLKINNETFVLHTIPSGIFHQNVMNVIGNGVVIDPVTFKKETEKLQALGVDVKTKLLISNRAHLILPTHKALDAASETKKGDTKIGSTLRGIGPTYMDKTGRNGLRVGDILLPAFEERYRFLKEKHYDILKQYDYKTDIQQLEEEWFEGVKTLKKLSIVATEYYLNQALAKGKKVLAEGAQGSMLDIDFGTYPFVTSSNTIAAGACTGLGIAPARIKEVIGITKAYATRVGSGPFPTELTDETGDKLRQIGREYGATTGRPRRCGWIDLPALKYSVMINGLTQLIITKIDVLNTFDTLKICTEYKINGKKTTELPFDLCKETIEAVYKEFKGWNCDISAIQHFDDLPPQLINYIHFIEEYLQIPVTIISNGPKRDELILRSHAAAV